MKKFFFMLALSFIIGCAGIVNNNTGQTGIKTRTPVNLMQNDVLISFVIEGMNFSKQRKETLENALKIAKRYNLTFDLAVAAEQFNRKTKDVYGIYEDNRDVFEVIAYGLNFKNPVDEKRTGEFYDTAIKKEIPDYMQEEKIRNMKDKFEKEGLKSATEVFLVPYYAGDENTIKLAEKYGYKLIIQEYTDKTGNPVMNYPLITATKCYVNVPNRVNIMDRDINYIKTRMQKFLDSRVKRIYIILHPVNFSSQEALYYTEKLINEISFRFKTTNVFYGMITDGIR